MAENNTSIAQGLNGAMVQVLNERLRLLQILRVKSFGDPRAVRLTDERIAHILEHEEMTGQLDKVEKAVREPDVVVRNQRDSDVHLYHKHYLTTPVTEKELLVAVKVTQTDAFVLTAFFTDTIKKGERIWEK